MSLDHWVAIIAAAISAAGLLLVAIQMRAATKQRELESLVEILSVNRELISLAFSHPRLLRILQDANDVDAVSEQYYLQLWLNHFALTYFYIKRAVLSAELEENLRYDVADFMAMQNMRRQWHRCGKIYPKSFQQYVNDLLSKIEPPPSAAQSKPK